MNKDVRTLCKLDKELYSCISDDIDSDTVVLTDKSDVHMILHHPDAYKDILLELKETIKSPDYIFKDDKHNNTGLVVRRIESTLEPSLYSFLVLKICTDSENGKYANSIISGWKISNKRLQSYLRNKKLLYRKKSL